MEWNDTKRDYPRDKCVHELFEAQVERTPDAVAVVCEDQRLTYGELNARANQLARHLRTLAVGPETTAAICVGRSLDMVVSILGILKAGGAWLPLDPAYPKDRLEFMLKNAGVSVLVTQESLVAGLPEHLPQTVLLDADWPVISQQNGANPDTTSTPANLAYVIYTSGSTGLPKGVMIPHRSLSHYVQAMREPLGITAKDVYLHTATIAFSSSVRQFMLPLTCGARMVIAIADKIRQPAALFEMIKSEGVTIIDIVPSYWRNCINALAGLETAAIRALLDNDIRLIVTASEPLMSDLPRKWTLELKDGARLINMFGQTETTGIVSVYPIPPSDHQDAKIVHIGRPIANTQIYLLDPQGQPVPAGVVGEIYVAGAGLGRGYLNRPELTAERFVPNPFGDESGARLYRTGDLGRHLPDGPIEFVGRTDQQVKIRGFRVELGEIDSVLNCHAAVRHAVVIAREDAPGQNRLVAYVVPNPAQTPTTSDLRGFLSKRLPDYMVPASFVFLESLPLTPTGKVDHRALSATGQEPQRMSVPFSAPRTECEKTLCSIWSDLLNLDKVGIDDNFFELGGDSILGIQIIARATKAGIQITPQQLLKYPTIRTLAAAAGTVPPAQAEQELVIGPLPLTPIMHWFLEQKIPNPHHYNQAVMLEVRQDVDPSLLARAVQNLLTHHDVLRLRCVQSETGHELFIAEPEVGIPFLRVDGSAFSDAANADAAAGFFMQNLAQSERTQSKPSQGRTVEIASAELQGTLNLSHGPLMRVAFVDFGPSRSGRLLICIHHFAVDGISWRILLEDLQTAYDQLHSGKSIQLSPKTTSFKQWAQHLLAYAQSGTLQEELSYWLAESRKRVSRLPVDFPAAREANTVESSRGVSKSLTVEETRILLQEVPEVYRTQMNDVLLTALVQAFASWTGARSLLVDLEGHGREDIGVPVDLTRTMGWFTTVFPVLLDLDTSSSTGEDLKLIKEQLRKIPKRGIGYGLLRYLSGNAEISENLQNLPQAEVRFNYLGQFDRTLSDSSFFNLTRESCGPARDRRGVRRYLIDVFGSVVGGQLQTDWTFSKNVHRRATIEGLAERFIKELRFLIAHCQSLGARRYTPSDFPLANQDSVLQLPTVVPAPEQQHLPFPLTDIQQAYWIGRSGVFELGNVSTHRYMEFEGVDLDFERFNQAWRRLVDRHDMLRAVVSSDGQQRILQQVPSYQIEVLDVRGRDPQVVASELEAVRARMSHQVLPSDQWPLFEFRASRLDDRCLRLHFSFDALILDFWSRSLLFREWSQLYRHPEISLPPLEISFRDYVLAEVALRDSEKYRRSQDYWRSRLSTLPPAPELPLAKNAASLINPRFGRRSGRLEREQWLRLKSRATRAGLTPSGVLLAAYADVINVWSKSPRFTINVTLFNRLPLHAQVNDIVGDFTSLTLLEVDNSAQETFESRARRLQERLWNDLDHRYTSGVQVMRELARRQGETAGAPMPVVFTSAIASDSRFDISNWTSWLGEVVYEITQTPQVWLDHQVSERGGALTFNWDAVEELFPKRLLEDMFNAYCRLLGRLADDDDSWQECWPDTALKLIPPAHLKLQASANATQAQPPTGLLHTLFSEQVSRRADHPAVVSPSRRLTYNELSRRSLQVAHWLRRHGATPNRLVAVVMEKGWEQVVAVLGILRSGAAYLPIDPNLPKERLWYLLDHGQVQLALTQPCIDKTLEWPEDIQRLCVSDTSLEGLEDTPLDQVQRAEDLAYVIYTSGSTGLPKGVMINHRGALNTILDINRRFSVAATDRVLALSSLSFDLSVYDIFGTLAAGGTIVIPEASGVRDPAHWAEIVAQEKVTVWNSVPALMELMVEYLSGRPGVPPHSLRLVLLSGDWVPVSLPDRIKALAKGVQVISLGGATEASIWSILYPVETVDPAWKSIPYGRAMMNQSFHVLNEALEPRPLWVPGQLYIGGIGLAKGYWRDEEKSCASFIHHPRTGERLYKTGDLGRYVPDGNIEFLGREDFQVKIQGYRVELGEIEAGLAEHPGVRAAVVTAVGQAPGDPSAPLRTDKRLVAYVVPEQDPFPTAGELSRFLKQKLPEYMVPSAYVTLDHLPLTGNGKVDRQALPEPAAPGAGPVEYATAERTNLTTRIAGLAAEILKVNHIEPEANLLNLGATSIDMIRIANLLDRELSFRPKMDVFYRLPTVAALARSYEQHLLQNRIPSPRVEQGMEPTLQSLVASFKLLLDPGEREAFKNRQPGLRQGGHEKAHVELPITEPDIAIKQQYAEHRSYRQFAPEPMSVTRLSRFLSCLRQIELNGKPKYLYASAGGLYPVQTYLHVKPGRIEGLGAGIYYYHPVDHRLVLLTADADLDRGIYHPFINAPIFDEAAFAIFLIAQLKAIAPMYGERSVHFATLEAGEMTHLLESTGPGCGIGLCQIGTLDFQRVRHLFALDEGHTLMHSLLGGRIDNNARAGWRPFQEAFRVVTSGDREEGTL